MTAIPAHPQAARSIPVKFRHTFDPIDIGQQEYHYNELAQQAGIVVPEFRLIDGKYFATRRFDIDKQGNRLHMATASGRLNEPLTPPKMDYHSLLQLTGYLTQSPEAVEQQFRRMVFNHYARNFDDHARNFSFLYRDGANAHRRGSDYDDIFFTNPLTTFKVHLAPGGGFVAKVTAE
ncbi:MAG: HipA domain-containing protein [Bacteroidales bacterium]|nr:HipA domain-containing protein [Bacteroidales bacterium]